MRRERKRKDRGPNLFELYTESALVILVLMDMNADCIGRKQSLHDFGPFD